MMRFDRFTERAQEAAQRAAEIIQRYGHNQIDTEHILLALIEQPGGVIPQILEKLSVSPEALTERLDATLRASPKANIFGGGAMGGDEDSGPGFAVVLLVSFLVYVISFVLMMALSRYREFAADRGAALITGAPENLMSALQKIASQMTRIPQRDLREMQGMNAFYIVPTNVKQSVGSLFLTHPPLEKRLERLSAIAAEMGRPQPM